MTISQGLVEIQNFLCEFYLCYYAKILHALVVTRVFLNYFSLVFVHDVMFLPKHKDFVLIGLGPLIFCYVL